MATAREIPSALDAFGRVLAELGEPPAVFLDFDGTLAPIAADPAEAEMPPATRRVLEELAERLPVAIVSGREVDDVRGRVGLDGLVYVGDHGFAIRGPVEAKGLPRPPGMEAQLAEVETELARTLAEHEGVLVEDKSYSIAVHHRQAAPEAAAEVRQAVADALADRSLLQARGGKQVAEIVPAVDWDKGRAVELVRSQLGQPAPSPLFLGDDETDETAFQAMPPEGVGVLVASEPRSTHADFRLSGPDEVRAFLQRLTGGPRSSGGGP